MAARNFQSRVFTLNHDMVIIEGNVVIGGTGAVGTIKGSGVKNVIRNSLGNYTIVLEDTYQRYLGGFIGMIHTGTNGSGISSVEVADYAVNAGVQAGTGIIVQCFDGANAKADPIAGSVMGFFCFLRNSSIKGKGE